MRAGLEIGQSGLGNYLLLLHQVPTDSRYGFPVLLLVLAGSRVSYRMKDL
jgi:hypothetical protein